MSKKEKDKRLSPLGEYLSKLQLFKKKKEAVVPRDGSREAPKLNINWEREKEKEDWLMLPGEFISNATELLSIWNGQEDHLDRLMLFMENKKLCEGVVKNRIIDKLGQNGLHYFMDHEKEEFNRLVREEYRTLLHRQRVQIHGLMKQLLRCKGGDVRLMPLRLKAPKLS